PRVHRHRPDRRHRLGGRPRRRRVTDLSDASRAPAGPAGPTGPTAGRWVSGGWAVGLLVADVALAMALFARAWSHPATVTAGARQDAPYTVWALAWVAHALRHGHSPWITTSLSWPAGVNLLTNATATGIGIVLAPVTALWGPLVAFNVAATGALAATAWSAQLVLRRSGLASWPAATVGGIVAGFGPTSVVQTAGGHLHVASAFLIPPMLLGVGRLASGTARYPGRWGAAVGALAAAQILVGEEVLATVAIAVALAIAIGGRWVRWRAVAQGAAVGAPVFALLAAGPLLVQFTGRGHIAGPIQLGEHYADDLAAFVVPAGHFWLRPPGGDRIARHYSSEGGAYLGLPLLVAAVAVVARRWRDPRVRVLGLTAAAVALLSLGSHLTVAGHRSPVPLPWRLVAHLPLLQSLLPVRFGVVLDLLVGALLAVGLDRLASGAGPGKALRAAAVAVVCLLPLVPRLPLRTTTWSVPAAFRNPGRTGIPSGAVVVISPYPSERDPEVEVWLSVAGDRWRTSGGTYFVPGPRGRVTIGGHARPDDVVDAALEAGLLTAAAARAAAGAVRASLAGISAVVAGPGPHADEVVAYWTALLGPPHPVGGVDVWPVPSSVGLVAGPGRGGATFPGAASPQGSGATRAMAATSL
ncbi:MAG TPA: hypothetical protein VGI06_08920, partial [Acidimicrobiales bacterium]